MARNDKWNTEKIDAAPAKFLQQLDSDSIDECKIANIEIQLNTVDESIHNTTLLKLRD